MHPNAFLRTYWRGEIRPEIFVAMSFAPEYEDRFKNVIEPAISMIKHKGNQLRANRVDLSKSGDSILTDIVDGIAHCEIVLADVSTVGHDSKHGRSYRNGNVMYEVGVALACRHSSEVLLIRDDHDKFLFDVSTVPHKHIEFSNPEAAKKELADELVSRLREQNHIHDARTRRMISTLTSQERQVLALFARYGMGDTFYLEQNNLVTIATLPRLLDKQLISTAAITDTETAAFRWTRLGYDIARQIDSLIPIIKTKRDEQPAPADNTPGAAT